MDTVTTESTTNQTQTGQRGAVVRQIKRKDGKQSWIQINGAQSAPAPHFRAVSLDDYVAQIHGQQQEEASEETLQQIQADDAALEVVAKIDRFRRLEESNRAAAQQDVGSFRDVEVAQPAADSETPQQQEVARKALGQDIAVAIASVLNDKDISALSGSEEVVGGAEGINVRQIALSAQVSHDYPSQYVFVNSSDKVAAENVEMPVADRPAAETKTEPALKAAWTVESFVRSQTIQRLSSELAIGKLSESCVDLLGSFGKTISVTSPYRGAGATTIAFALSDSLARSGRRILLVDANLENSSLSRDVGLRKLSWLPFREEPISESLVMETETGLCLMPLDLDAAHGYQNGVPALDLLDRMIRPIRDDFDMIVIDAGEARQMLDGLSEDCQLIDAALMVANDVHCESFAKARESLINRGVYKFVAANNSFVTRSR